MLGIGPQRKVLDEIHRCSCRFGHVAVGRDTRLRAVQVLEDWPGRKEPFEVTPEDGFKPGFFSRGRSLPS